MSLDLDTIINLLIAVIYAIFLVFFSFQTIRKKRSAPYLIMTLVCGFLGSFFAFIDSSELFPSFSPYSRIYLIIELVLYGFQFFFFYLFLEDISNIRPNIWHLLLMFGNLVLQNLALWLIVWFSAFSNEAVANLWFLADLGYNNLGLLAFAGFGLPIYLKQYRYTKEKKAIAFIIGLLFVSLGYVVHSLVDYLGYFNVAPDWFGDFAVLGNILPMVGLSIFLIVYIIDIDYIYRLPTDHYLLMVAYKSGIAIHTVEFETKKQIEVKENLFSGFMSSISFVFDQILESEAPIENITSKEASILVRSGNNIIVVMLVRQPTAILERAMDKYIERFEKKFRVEIDKQVAEINKYDKAKELITPIFPFLKIKKTK